MILSWGHENRIGLYMLLDVVELKFLYARGSQLVVLVGKSLGGG